MSTWGGTCDTCAGRTDAVAAVAAVGANNGGVLMTTLRCFVSAVSRGGVVIMAVLISGDDGGDGVPIRSFHQS